MNKVNWSVLPTVLKEKYETIIGIEYELMVSHLLNESGRMPIKVAENCTNSYLIFSKEYNAMLLTAHCFENLLMFEDIRHEQNGHAWFQIEIPLEYFRYPAFNNPRDNFFFRETLSEEESVALADAVKSTKETMHYGNDENIVKENLHKLEFLSIFSYFEAYLENILVESLGYDERKASKTVKYNSLDKLLKLVINEVNSEIENLLISIKPDLFKFIEFCYLIRNSHTHSLGRATADFMQKCTERDLIEKEFGLTETGEKIYTGSVITNFGEPNKYIELDRYITLSVLSFHFRNYVRECVFIIESCVLENNSSNP